MSNWVERFGKWWNSCERLGHDYQEVSRWIDEKEGFVRAVNRCTRCGDSYDWEPFGFTANGVPVHYVTLDGKLAEPKYVEVPCVLRIPQ